jgi:hypothetical protein
VAAIKAFAQAAHTATAAPLDMSTVEEAFLRDTPTRQPFNFESSLVQMLWSRFILTFFCVALLITGCTEQRWPVPADGQMASDLPIVQKRYDSASKSSLGTSQDISDIKRRIQSEPLNLKEIRWLSPTEAMVLADWGRDLGYERYICVLVMKDGKWRMIERYLAAVS